MQAHTLMINHAHRRFIDWKRALQICIFRLEQEEAGVGTS